MTTRDYKQAAQAVADDLGAQLWMEGDLLPGYFGPGEGYKGPVSGISGYNRYSDGTPRIESFPWAPDVPAGELFAAVGGWDNDPELAYWTTLHELGHIGTGDVFTPRPFFLFSDPQDELESEARSWIWAAEHAVVPASAHVTNYVFNPEFSFGTYLDGLAPMLSHTYLNTTVNAVYSAMTRKEQS